MRLGIYSLPLDCYWKDPFEGSLPPDTAMVAAPQALDLESRPKLLLCADGLAPHAQPHQEAASEALNRYNVAFMWSMGHSYVCAYVYIYI